MEPEDNTYCYYSDLPSPMAYMQAEENLNEPKQEGTSKELHATIPTNSEDIRKPIEPNTHA
jgi:hypothetical protein